MSIAYYVENVRHCTVLVLGLQATLRRMGRLALIDNVNLFNTSAGHIIGKDCCVGAATGSPDIIRT